MACCIYMGTQPPGIRGCDFLDPEGMSVARPVQDTLSFKSFRRESAASVRRLRAHATSRSTVNILLRPFAGPRYTGSHTM